MSFFNDEAEVYARLGTLLRELVADEQIGARLQRIDTIVQCRLRAPDARLTIKALAAEAREVAVGDTGLQPEVVLTMDADTAHRFWLGELNPAVALASGDIQTRGPASKILALIPLTVAASQRYRAQLDAPPVAEEEPADAPPAAEQEPPDAAEQGPIPPEEAPAGDEPPTAAEPDQASG